MTDRTTKTTVNIHNITQKTKSSHTNHTKPRAKLTCSLKVLVSRSFYWHPSYCLSLFFLLHHWSPSYYLTLLWLLYSPLKPMVLLIISLPSSPLTPIVSLMIDLPSYNWQPSFFLSFAYYYRFCLTNDTLVSLTIAQRKESIHWPVLLKKRRFLYTCKTLTWDKQYKGPLRPSKQYLAFKLKTRK